MSDSKRTPIIGRNNSKFSSKRIVTPGKVASHTVITKNINKITENIEALLALSGAINLDANLITLYDKKYNKLIISYGASAKLSLKSKRCHLRYPV